MLYPLLYAALAAIVAASPVELEARAATTTPFCSKVTSLVAAVKQQSAATAFCSSYLGIKAVTKSTTQTITSSGGTSTKIISTAFMTLVVSTTTTTVTSISVKNECSATPSALKVKRAGNTVSKPSCLNSFTTGAILSSACSCLSIPTPTTTVTKSTTSFQPTTTLVTTTSTVTTIATATETAFTDQFYLIASGGSVDGGYAAQTDYIEGKGDVFVFNGTKANAVPFDFNGFGGNPPCGLDSGGYARDNGNGAMTAYPYGGSTDCRYDNNTNTLACMASFSVDSVRVSSVCAPADIAAGASTWPYAWYFQATNNDEGSVCPIITLKVAPYP